MVLMGYFYCSNVLSETIILGTFVRYFSPCAFRLFLRHQGKCSSSLISIGVFSLSVFLLLGVGSYEIHYVILCD